MANATSTGGKTYHNPTVANTATEFNKHNYVAFTETNTSSLEGLATANDKYEDPPHNATTVRFRRLRGAFGSALSVPLYLCTFPPAKTRTALIQWPGFSSDLINRAGREAWKGGTALIEAAGTSV